MTALPLSLQAPILAVSWDPSSTKVAAGCGDKRLKVVDTKTGVVDWTVSPALAT